MARIQILELPAEEVGSARVTPFALIIDQCTMAEINGLLGEALAGFRDACGARAGLITAETIDIPGSTVEVGNGTSLGSVHVKVVPDLEGFGEQVAAAIADANARLAEAINQRGTGVYYGDKLVDDAPEPNAEMQEAARRVRDIVRRQP